MSTSTELAKRGPRSIAARHEGGWSAEEIQLIKDTVATDLTDDEFKAFCYVARERHLNPLLKQIYAIKRRTKDGPRVAHQTSIDGFRATAARTKLHAGTDDAVFTGDPGKANFKATVTVWKLVGGVRCPFVATARWEEYNPGTGLWSKMPHSQLGKCAEALALRKAFPEDLGGLYTADEMAQADVVDVSAVTVPRTLPPPPAAAEPVRIGGRKVEEAERSAKKRKAETPPIAPEEHEKWCGCDRCMVPGDAVAVGPVTAPVVDVKISHQQRVLLWTCVKEQKVSEEQLRAWVREIAGVESTSDIPRDRFEALLARVENKPDVMEGATA